MTRVPSPRPRPLHRPPLAGIRVLAALALVAAGPMPWSGGRAARAEKLPVVDVVIVGAGMAGLTAARTLQAAGKSFVVLEAQDRIGGRAVATPSNEFGLAIDLGGAWIHGPRTNPLTPIIDGMGFTRVPTHVDASEYFFFNRRFARADDREELKREMEAFEASLASHVRRAYAKAEQYESEHSSPKDEVRAQAEEKAAVRKARGEERDRASNFLPASWRLRRLVAANAGPLESADDLDHTSAVDSAEFIANEDMFILESFGEFVKAWGKDIPVKLKKKVIKVAWAPGDVAVTTEDGDVYRGRKVLLTVSTGVLGAGVIKFEPELPDDKKEAIRTLKMGVLDKVIMGFKSDIFPRPLDPDGQPHVLDSTWVLYSGTAPDDGGEEEERFEMSFVLRPGGKLAAVGFFGGAAARALEKDEPRMKKLALDALAEICGKKPAEIQGELTRVTVTKWGLEPWTLGAYSAAEPGGWKAHDVLAAPVKDSLYFAGEAAGDSAYNGSYAAAYASALQAAYAIIRTLPPKGRK